MNFLRVLSMRECCIGVDISSRIQFVVISLVQLTAAIILSMCHIKLISGQSGVTIIQLDRLTKRNALTQSMITELVSTLERLDQNDEVHVVVITGGAEGPFCAGMDLNELITLSTSTAHEKQFLKDLTDAFARFTKPLIAAVVGFALGGGFEIALACDIIYAADDAQFGLPEIKIGTIPGAGGTQRLTRAMGKHRAMEFIFSGDFATGKEFHSMGVVNKIFPGQEVLPAAVQFASRLSSLSGPVLRSAKQAIVAAENSHLDIGITIERGLYYSTFSLNDCKEGLNAFIEKRKPEFGQS